ncbi:MAG: hypothetical protein WBZ33_15055, partial [Thermoactinomyces sp.]
VLTQMPQGDWQNWKLDHNGAGEAETLKVSGRNGDLMFSVADFGGNIIDEPYHLIIKVLPASGDGNDHSTLVKAVPLPQAKWVKGEFTEGAAWDWYVFNTKQRETATFLYQANQPVKSLEWAIYDADLLAISSGTVTLAKGERFSKTVSLPPGRHYIRVRTDERHPVSYQIQIKKTKSGRKQKVNPTKQ